MRKVLTIAVLLGIASSAEAFGRREARVERREERRSSVFFESKERYTETSRGFNYSYSEKGCVNGTCPAPLLVPVVPSKLDTAPFPKQLPPNLKSSIEESDGAVDALHEVNAKRAARGLRPYIRDDGLTEGARRLALARARSRIFGHVTTNGGDFAYLPAGARADVAGCAAYPPEYGWLSCAIYDNYTYAGAAWVMGSDGKRYMHLFARN